MTSLDMTFMTLSLIQSFGYLRPIDQQIKINMSKSWTELRIHRISYLAMNEKSKSQIVINNSEIFLNRTSSS